MVMDFLSHGADPLQTGIVKGFGNAQPQLLLLLFYIQIIIILLRCISLLIYQLLAEIEQKFTAPLNGLHGQRWISIGKGHEKFRGMSGKTRTPHKEFWSVSKAALGDRYQQLCLNI